MDQEKATLKTYELLTEKLSTIVNSISDLSTKSCPTSHLVQFALLANRLYTCRSLRVKNLVMSDWLNKNKSWVGDLKNE